MNYYDIYFTHAYGKLNEWVDQGTCHVFQHHSPYGTIRHMFIKRPIPETGSQEIWYDLVTPYGYGGPLCQAVVPGKEAELLHGFEEDFGEYCQRHRIVSEFIRFHPLAGNADCFQNLYEIRHDRKTVGTDLQTYSDPYHQELSKSCRANIRKALKNGLEFRITENPSKLEDFMAVYYHSLNRNGSSDYYYFPKEYFDQCIRDFRDHLLLAEVYHGKQILSMGLCFIWSRKLFIHLSGTAEDAYHRSAAYLLRHGILEWAGNHGVHLVYHGGGKSSRDNDSLYVFKKRFGMNTSFPFYTGKRIWNQAVYDDLCNRHSKPAESCFFPSYRER